MFQFGIRSMLAVTFAAAALFGAVFALPPAFGVPLLTYVNRLLVPLLIAGVVYSKGYGRAFAIGGLTWYGLPMIFNEDLAQAYSTAWVGMMPAAIEPDRSQHLLRLLLAGVSGMLALCVRYVSLSRPPVAAPAVSEAEGAKPPMAEEPRERLPYWLVPVSALLLLVAAMVGWLKVESGAWSASGPPGATYSTPYTTSATMTVNGTVISNSWVGQPPTVSDLQSVDQPIVPTPDDASPK